MMAAIDIDWVFKRQYLFACGTWSRDDWCICECVEYVDEAHFHSTSLSPDGRLWLGTS